MKSYSLFTALLLLCCIACQKDQNIPARVVIVTELGTGLPVAGAEVNLLERFTFSYYPPFYTFIDSLGLTNEQGVFYWEWNGDTLPFGSVLKFEHPGYYNSGDDYASAGAQGQPDDTIRGALHPPGYVQFHFRLTPDTLLRKFVVYDLPPGASDGLFAYYLCSSSLGTSLDETITAQVMGHAYHHFRIVVLPDNADYINVWPTLHSQDTTMFCPARNTTFVEAVF